MTGRGAAHPPAALGVWCAVARAVDVPSGESWLTPAERPVEAGLRVAKRRDDWRLGRWVAKSAVRRCLSAAGEPPPVERIGIIAADDGAPEVVLPERSAPALSLSHSAGVGFAVAATALGGAGPRPSLGCDLERIEERSAAFVRDYLTQSERDAVAEAAPELRATCVTLAWSGKEAVLKLLRSGLRSDPRGVEVQLEVGSASAGPSWSPLTVVAADGRACRGWWTQRAGFIWTVMTSAPVRPVLHPDPGFASFSG